MNLAIIIPELGGGGAEKAAVQLGDYFSDKGSNVYYFLFHTMIKDKYVPKGRIIHTHVDMDINNDDSDMAVMYSLEQKAKVFRRLKIKYDIDVSISFMEISNYINILSDCGEKNIVSVRTTLSYRKDFGSPLYRRSIVHRMYNSADLIICVSNYAGKDLISKYGIQHKLVCVIQNSISISEDKKIDEKIDGNWKYGKKAIITVGRLDKIKQQHHIINAFYTLSKEDKDVRLVILGEGPLRSQLENLCQSLDIKDKVYMPGFVKKTSSFLKNSRIFVMTSEVEGFPNAMIEAMSYGLPVISMDSPGGCGEILGKEYYESIDCDYIREKYGILTKYSKENSDRILPEEEILAKCMRELLDDNSLYEHYSEQSKKRALMYGKDEIMTLWESKIENYTRRNVMKRKLLVFLSGTVGAVASAVLVMKKGAKRQQEQKKVADKHWASYMMMNQWVRNNQQGKKISEYLISKGYKRIAIYGFAYVGETLVDELKDSQVEIAYIIDKNAKDIYSNYPVYSPEDTLQEVDAVIVTPFVYYDQISGDLRKQLKCPVFAIDDIVFEM